MQRFSNVVLLEMDETVLFWIVMAVNSDGFMLKDRPYIDHIWYMSVYITAVVCDFLFAEDVE